MSLTEFLRLTNSNLRIGSTNTNTMGEYFASFDNLIEICEDNLLHSAVGFGISLKGAIEALAYNISNKTLRYTLNGTNVIRQTFGEIRPDIPISK